MLSSLFKSYSSLILDAVMQQYQHFIRQTNVIINRIENNTSEADRELLLEATSVKYNATLLPIRTVGVQVRLSQASDTASQSCKITVHVFKSKAALYSLPESQYVQFKYNYL